MNGSRELEAFTFLAFLVNDDGDCVKLLLQETASCGSVEASLEDRLMN